MRQIECLASELGEQRDKIYDVAVYESFFEPRSKLRTPNLPFSGDKYPLPNVYFENLKRCAELVSEGGILFVYGLPHDLPYYGSYLNTLELGDFRFIFKYWIVLNIDNQQRGETLQPAHQGLLLYVKSKSSNKTSNGFHLTTNKCRIPHRYCSHCKMNLKDWGGKKHLMNPAGSAPSDAWNDLQPQAITDNRLPQSARDRIVLLTEEKANVLFVTETEHESLKFAPVESSLRATLYQEKSTSVSKPALNPKSPESTAIEWNNVYQEDSILLMKRILSTYPDGIFDLVFADPPYNLEKKYDKYSDDKSARDYVQWCNEWLRLCAKVLKPGGALVILNLPKWAVYHALFLHSMLDFRHWIYWDAMADPRGKLLPAHYALLYYTKPGSDIKFRYSTNIGDSSSDFVEPPESPEYCLRQSCINARKKVGDNRRAELSDIWFNVHRIKHKRDRDYHPCQLPEKLMDRIIRLTTDSGDKIFDPFAGVGTTAIIAQRLGRDFITSDIDPNYGTITREKLERERYEVGFFRVPIKKTVRRDNNWTAQYSKKKVETTLQALALRLGHLPTMEDIEASEPWVLAASRELYDDIRQPLKAAKIALRTNGVKDKV